MRKDKYETLSKIKKRPGALPLAWNFPVEEVGEGLGIGEGFSKFDPVESKGSNLGDP